MTDFTPPPAPEPEPEQQQPEREAAHYAALAPIYEALRRVARQPPHGVDSSSPLRPDALANEVFAKMANSPAARRVAGGRAHFLALAARAMRRLLAEHAARHRARRVALHDPSQRRRLCEIDAIALHDALESLAALDARLADVVELRFFGGLDLREIAGLLQLPERTVDREWAFGRAWLLRRLRGRTSL